eukprot:683142-Rhodomonas_salina.8
MRVCLVSQDGCLHLPRLKSSNKACIFAQSSSVQARQSTFVFHLVFRSPLTHSLGNHPNLTKSQQTRQINDRVQNTVPEPKHTTALCPFQPFTCTLFPRTTQRCLTARQLRDHPQLHQVQDSKAVRALRLCGRAQWRHNSDFYHSNRCRDLPRLDTPLGHRSLRDVCCAPILRVRRPSSSVQRDLKFRSASLNVCTEPIKRKLGTRTKRVASIAILTALEIARSEIATAHSQEVLRNVDEGMAETEARRQISEGHVNDDAGGGTGHGESLSGWAVARGSQDSGGGSGLGPHERAMGVQLEMENLNLSKQIEALKKA